MYVITVDQLTQTAFIVNFLSFAFDTEKQETPFECYVEEKNGPILI